MNVGTCVLKQVKHVCYEGTLLIYTQMFDTGTVGKRLPPCYHKNVD